MFKLESTKYLQGTETLFSVVDESTCGAWWGIYGIQSQIMLTDEIRVFEGQSSPQRGSVYMQDILVSEGNQPAADTTTPPSVHPGGSSQTPHSSGPRRTLSAPLNPNYSPPGPVDPSWTLPGPAGWSSADSLPGPGGHKSGLVTDPSPGSVH